MPTDEPESDEAHPYSDDVLALLMRHVSEHPDPDVLLDAWATGFLFLLANVVKAHGMLQVDIDAFLADICARITEHTPRVIRLCDHYERDDRETRPGH